MKTLKEIANKYAELHYPADSKHNAYSGARNGFMAGYNFAKSMLDWIDVNDRTKPIPKNRKDILIKLENGKIYRYEENWERERKIVTHWRFINLPTIEQQ